MRFSRSDRLPGGRLTLAGRWTIRPARSGLWLAGIFLFCFFYFLPRQGDWNQNSRLDLILAIVNHQAISIDGYQWNTGVDSVYFHGHYYMNKAPGQSLVGLLIYAGLRALLGWGGEASLPEHIGLAGWWHSLYSYYFLLQCLETMYTVAIPAVLLLMLFFWFLRFFLSSLLDRLLLTLALGMGTSVFAYSQVFYPHVPCAGLLFAAFVILYVMSHAEDLGPSRARWLCTHPIWAMLLCGFSLGLSVLYDHTTAIIAAGLAGYALVRIPLRTLPFLAVGALPFLAAAGVYDLAAYHNATVTGYNVYGSGIAGSDSSWPPAGYGLFGLTFSPYRGLFFLSPFLLLAIPGLFFWAKRGGWEWLVCAGIPISFIVAISTVSFWHGGVAVGPRYLVPIIPFLALPVAFVLTTMRSGRARLAVYGLIVLSAALTWIETLGGRGYPPVHVPDPLFSYSIPALLHARLPLSLGTVLVEPVAGLNSLWSLAPLAVVILAWSFYCFRPRRAPQPIPELAEAAA
jgi:hypothetical protein